MAKPPFGQEPFSTYKTNIPKSGPPTVTICIAAICKDGMQPAIVLCADHRSSGALGTSDKTRKQRRLGSDGRWLCLGAGDDDEIAAVHAVLRPKFISNRIDETNLKPVIEAALRECKTDKINSMLQAKFPGITYVEFIKSGREWFGEKKYYELNDQIEFLENTEMDVGFIIAGFEDNMFPTLAVTSGSRVRIEGKPYSVIGSGEHLARAALLFRNQDDTTPLHRTIYNIYEAKKTAEREARVGVTETVLIHRISQETEEVSAAGLEYLRNKFAQYGPKQIDETIELPQNSMIKWVPPGKHGG